MLLLLIILLLMLLIINHHDHNDHDTNQEPDPTQAVACGRRLLVLCASWQPIIYNISIVYHIHHNTIAYNLEGRRLQCNITHILFYTIVHSPSTAGTASLSGPTARSWAPCASAAPSSSTRSPWRRTNKYIYICIYTHIGI